MKRAKVHGIKVFIDPHQDAFSRFTGGSGAPGWVVESVGFDVRNMAASEAALIQNFIEPPTAYPRMIWPTNLHKLGCATMFTMFFGGKVFADKIFVDGKNIQDYLQGK